MQIIYVHMMISISHERSRFRSRIRHGSSVVCDGELQNPSELDAVNCNKVILYLASSTSNRSENPVSDVLNKLDQAEKKGYAAIRGEHTGFQVLWNAADRLGPIT